MQYHDRTITCRVCGKSEHRVPYKMQRPGQLMEKNKDGHTVHGRYCYECRLRRYNDYLKRVKPKVLKRAGNYRKTKTGFLVVVYAGIVSRCKGGSRRTRHIYFGKKYEEKQAFYDWALSRKDFHDQWAEWEAAGYPRRLTPSIDRIDNDGDYLFGNMQWLPNHLNASKSMRQRWDVFYNEGKDTFHNRNIR